MNQKETSRDMTGPKFQESKNIKKISKFSWLKESWQCCSRMLRDMEINYSSLTRVILTREKFPGLNAQHGIIALTQNVNNCNHYNSNDQNYI